jgi:chemotaxis protein CheY-P-specific phosphatase CheC
MNSAISGILTEVVVDTLEKLAFLFAAPLEEAASEDTEKLATVRVRFSGPVCGGMQLSLSQPVLAELAGNMLGAEDGSALSEDEQHDALRELINVICGNLLPAMAGSEAVFKVLAPQIPATPLGQNDRLVARVQLAFDEGWADAALFLTEEAA